MSDTELRRAQAEKRSEIAKSEYLKIWDSLTESQRLRMTTLRDCTSTPWGRAPQSFCKLEERGLVRCEALPPLKPGRHRELWAFLTPRGMLVERAGRKAT